MTVADLLEHCFTFTEQHPEVARRRMVGDPQTAGITDTVAEFNAHCREYDTPQAAMSALYGDLDHTLIIAQLVLNTLARGWIN